MKSVIAIDVSSTNIKVGLVTIEGELICESIRSYNSEDDGGFGKILDMEMMWDYIINGIQDVLKTSKIDKKEIIAISSDSMRISFVFLKESRNKELEVLYGGPDRDIRGIDAQWVIDDEYEGKEGEEAFFNITAHSPSLIFGLARLLWYKEENEEEYDSIKKFLTLDDWIIYKFTDRLVSDSAVSSESQILDINKRTWSEEIIEKFDLNPDWFPSLVEIGSIVGSLKPNIAEQLGLSSEIPIIKSGPDTQTSFIGMGCIKEGDIGIPMGTSASIMMVINKPIIDPTQTLWTKCHSISDKWLMEANAGKTGMIFNWYKEHMLKDLTEDPNKLVEKHLSETKPGANFTFAYLGPEKMDFKNLTDIKRSVFVFPSQSTISDIVSDQSTFTRAVLENIAFGVLENVNALYDFSPSNNKEKTRIVIAGGMANSKEFVKILCNVLNRDIFIPKVKESAYLGLLINCLVGLKYYSSHEEAVDRLIKLEKITVDPETSQQYKSIYSSWKSYKNTIDKL